MSHTLMRPKPIERPTILVSGQNVNDTEVVIPTTIWLMHQDQGATRVSAMLSNLWFYISSNGTTSLTKVNIYPVEADYTPAGVLIETVMTEVADTWLIQSTKATTREYDNAHYEQVGHGFRVGLTRDNGVDVLSATVKYARCNVLS